jgi:hypothetical protein
MSRFGSPGRDPLAAIRILQPGWSLRGATVRAIRSGRGEQSMPVGGVELLVDVRTQALQAGGEAAEGVTATLDVGVGAGKGVNVRGQPGVKHDPGAERGEDELALEPELVEGLAALGGVEGRASPDRRGHAESRAAP